MIPILFSPNATTPGFRVAIFDGNNTQTPVGFASPVTGLPGLYEYDFTTPLTNGVHNITAEVQMVDPQKTAETGFGGASAALSITVDTVPPSVAFGAVSIPNSGLAGASDSGVPGQPDTIVDRITNVSTPSFYGVAEANSIVRLYVGTPAGNVQVGQTTAVPEDGTNALPGGAWTITSNIDLNHPSLGLPLDGVRNMFVTAEDLAGNVSATQELTIFIDTQGPKVNTIGITGAPTFPLFNTKTTPTPVASPTPLVGSLDINFSDQPVRVGPDFVYPAVNPILATTTSNYALVGENNGIIPVTSVTIVDNTTSGTPGNTTVTLHFSAKDTPLPDDRYTLTISDQITDNAGNALQGSFNGTSFPTGLVSGNGSQGQTFDNLSGSGGNTTSVPQPTAIDGLPVAGNFAGSPLVAGSNPPVTTFGDQVGLFDGKAWYLDVLNQGYISAADIAAPATATRPAGYLPSDMAGLPFVGNFDGDTDLGTYQSGVVEFDLASLDPNHILTGQWNVQVNVNHFFSSIPFNYVTARPVAGYFNGLGQESSIGFYVPDGTTSNPGTADWYLLEPTNSALTGAPPAPAAGLFSSGTVTAATPADRAALESGSYFFKIIHAFKDQTLGGNDAFYQFGNQFSLPVVGVWDPPGDVGGLTSGGMPSASVTGGFVAHLYTQVLGRQESANDVAYWVNRLQSGVNREFQTYLGRAADPASAQTLIEQLRSGMTQDQLLTLILSSAEYVNKSQG